MSETGDHKGRTYGFIVEFSGLRICSMQVAYRAKPAIDARLETDPNLMMDSQAVFLAQIFA